MGRGVPYTLERSPPLFLMAYEFQDRLRHVGDRMADLNKEPIAYIAGDAELSIMASPVLISPDEMDPNNVSDTRVERQDFVIDRPLLGPYYPPEIGHKIRRLRTGEEFILTSMGADEPPYVHTTSRRERVIVHTIRVKVET